MNKARNLYYSPQRKYCRKHHGGPPVKLNDTGNYVLCDCWWRPSDGSAAIRVARVKAKLEGKEYGKDGTS